MFSTGDYPNLYPSDSGWGEGVGRRGGRTMALGAAFVAGNGFSGSSRSTCSSDAMRTHRCRPLRGIFSSGRNVRVMAFRDIGLGARSERYELILRIRDELERPITITETE